MDGFGMRLREERERLGFNQADFASLAGQGTQSQSRYEAEKRAPDSAYLSKIASHGADILYLITGKRENDLITESVNEVISDLINFKIIPSEDVEKRPLSICEAPNVDDPDSFVMVPLNNIELAAGAGAQNDSESVGRHLLFRQDWMRKIGLSASDARLARVRGDSMLPLLSDSDLVLVDVTKTEVPVEPRRAGAQRRSHLVAIEQEGQCRVKWAERPDADTLILHSENTALYGPEIYARPDAERIRLIGRVVWWCHTVPIY